MGNYIEGKKKKENEESLIFSSEEIVEENIKDKNELKS
jgi:hypothetical protein